MARRTHPGSETAKPAEKKRIEIKTAWALRPFTWSLVILEKFLEKIIKPRAETEDRTPQNSPGAR